MQAFFFGFARHLYFTLKKLKLSSDAVRKFLCSSERKFGFEGFMKEIQD
jgi:hypothetical protein